MNQQDLDPTLLPGKTVVVLDVLFATTTIAMALHEGAREVITVPEVEHARCYADEASTILAGEKDAAIPEGFATFAPHGLSQRNFQNHRLVLVSTNGTVALHNASGADHVYAAALVNANAMCRHLLDQHHNGTILLVCAASRHRFNIEDFVGAGLFVDLLTSAQPDRFALTDAACAARNLAQGNNFAATLHGSRVGRMMHGMNLSVDVNLAAHVDRYPVVPKSINGRLVPVQGTQVRSS